MNIGILTGGGDVPGLNAVISSVQTEIKQKNGNLIGFVNGWDGVIKKKYININDLYVSPNIGGTILKSSRINITNIDNGIEIVRSIFSELHLDGLIVIGGEDTLSNVFHFPDLPIVLISKTIDNDFGKIIVNENKIKFINQFTVGYPTAAEKIASFVSLEEGLRTTAYSHERIIIVEAMGMHAGWLALASMLGGPDFIIIPEFPLHYDHFIELMIERYKNQKNIIAVISEGAKWNNGDYISADFNNQDSFGHPKFIGSSKILAEKVKLDLQKFMDARNVNYVNPSYLYRAGKPNNLDKETAIKLGREAVKIFEKDISNPIFIGVGSEKQIYRLSLGSNDQIEYFHRLVPKEFYDPIKYQATDIAENYFLTFLKKYNSIIYKL